MTDRPSDGSRRIVKVLVAVATKFAEDAEARRVCKYMDFEHDVTALKKSFADGIGDTGGGFAKDADGEIMSTDVILASDAHYKHLAHEIIYFSQMHPAEAPEILAKFLRVMELHSGARMNGFKKKVGLV